MNVFLDKSGLEHLCKLFMEKYCDKKQADELYLRKDGKAKKAETADKVAHAITVNGKAYDGSKAVTVEVNSGGSPFENNALKFPNGGLLEIVKAGESGGQEDPSHGGETVIWGKALGEITRFEGLPYDGMYRITGPDGVFTEVFAQLNDGLSVINRPQIGNIMAILSMGGGMISLNIFDIEVSKQEAKELGKSQEELMLEKANRWKIECIKPKEEETTVWSKPLGEVKDGEELPYLGLYKFTKEEDIFGLTFSNKQQIKLETLDRLRVETLGKRRWLRNLKISLQPSRYTVFNEIVYAEEERGESEEDLGRKMNEVLDRSKVECIKKA